MQQERDARHVNRGAGALDSEPAANRRARTQVDEQVVHRLAEHTHRRASPPRLCRLVLRCGDTGDHRVITGRHAGERKPAATVDGHAGRADAARHQKDIAALPTGGHPRHRAADSPSGRRQS